MPKSDRQIARDITYATSAATKSGRAVIRVMENTTGRIGLIKRAKGYEQEVAQGRDFWEVMTERYGIDLTVTRGSLDLIPREGPIVVVANHPYGILDGLVMGRILSHRRDGDFRILAHRVFRKAQDLDRIILPISFDDTKEAARLNIQTRADALRYLGAGGAIGIFPGGTVSTGIKPFAPPLDPGWRSFTARMVAKSEASVVPLYFEGANSKLFQLASHLHATLRTGLFIREFKSRVDTPVRLAIGDPIPRAQLAPLKGDTKALMDLLRRATYDLSGQPDLWQRRGHEFEERHKRNGGRDIR